MKWIQWRDINFISRERAGRYMHINTFGGQEETRFLNMSRACLGLFGTGRICVDIWFVHLWDSLFAFLCLLKGQNSHLVFAGVSSWALIFSRYSHLVFVGVVERSVLPSTASLSNLHLTQDASDISFLFFFLSFFKNSFCTCGFPLVSENSGIISESINNNNNKICQ